MGSRVSLYKDVFEEVAAKHGLPAEVVEKVYKYYWEFVKDTLSNLPLKDDMSEEEFSKLRTSINVPSLGKFSCTYDRYIGVKKRFIYIKKLKEHVESKKD